LLDALKFQGRNLSPKGGRDFSLPDNITKKESHYYQTLHRDRPMRQGGQIYTAQEKNRGGGQCDNRPYRLTNGYRASFRPFLVYFHPLSFLTLYCLFCNLP
jgi:hypothetical protein